MRRINKRGFEMSFGWMFSIIAGAVIIFLAIYATTQFIEVDRTQRDTEIGKEVGILLTPLETGLDTSRAAKIIMPVESRIFNSCDNRGNFGSQQISVSTRSGIGEEWQEAGVPSSFHNKYLFSSDESEGKNYNIFVKPLEMPFKVADLIFLWSDKESYCFVQPNLDVEDDINDLSLENMFVVSDVGECPDGSKSVCFVNSGCDIDVNENSKSVKKKRRTETVFYEGDLIYGAILSSPDTYNCQVKRLMGRASEIALLNVAKGSYLSVKGCRSDRITGNLISYSNKTKSLGESLELREINFLSDEIRRQNENLGCKLF
ncbi:hypothetical protein CMI45_00080 [Candidatus Pacearchaeota archaeon]|jgi:hypothetical protein|nr:hypothetical protein [Candidatus Pacearchaeota archaeon]|tara:strand:+ start:293 stop:1243 length:951 start_codon:yes stop_codon:yes gene_type:complete